MRWMYSGPCEEGSKRINIPTIREKYDFVIFSLNFPNIYLLNRKWFSFFSHVCSAAFFVRAFDKGNEVEDVTKISCLSFHSSQLSAIFVSKFRIAGLFSNRLISLFARNILAAYCFLDRYNLLIYHLCLRA